MNNYLTKKILVSHNVLLIKPFRFVEGNYSASAFVRFEGGLPLLKAAHPLCQVTTVTVTPGSGLIASEFSLPKCITFFCAQRIVLRSPHYAHTYLAKRQSF